MVRMGNNFKTQLSISTIHILQKTKARINRDQEENFAVCADCVRPKSDENKVSLRVCFGW